MGQRDSVASCRRSSNLNGWSFRLKVVGAFVGFDPATTKTLCPDIPRLRSWTGRSRPPARVEHLVSRDRRSHVERKLRLLETPSPPVCVSTRSRRQLRLTVTSRSACPKLHPLRDLANAINNSTGRTPGTDYVVTAADPNVRAVAASHTLTVTALSSLAAAWRTQSPRPSSCTPRPATAQSSTLQGATDSTDEISSLAELMVAALNASFGHITDAAFNSSTHVPTVAGTGDVLGDHRIIAAFINPSADPNLMVGIPGFIVSKVDAGSSGAALTLTLAADTYTPTTLFASLGEQVV